MPESYALLHALWRDGAIVVETPMDSTVATAAIVPGSTPLAFRTVVQWDGDIVHRFNPAGGLRHRRVHEAAMARIVTGLGQELTSAIGNLRWCERGLWVGRVSVTAGALILGGGQIEAWPLLHGLAAAYVYPAATALVGGASAEIGLRWLRGYIGQRFRAALETAETDEGRT